MATEVIVIPSEGSSVGATLPINLTTDVSGVLPIANGGTNSSSALNNSRVMISSAGAIIESSITTTDLALLTDSDIVALAALGTTGMLARVGAGAYITRTITPGTGISISNGDGVAGNPTITSTITQYTDENAQDAVGSILVDSSKIDFTYDDAANTITATIVAGSLVNADINASAAIAYSKLNLTGSIVNADINASAAIALTKLAALFGSVAVVTDASGFLTTSLTTSTEIGFVGGVTSAIQTQLNAKQPLDSDLTALAALSTTGVLVRTGSGTATTRTITQGTGGISISNGDGVSGNPTISFAALTATRAAITDGSGFLTTIGAVTGVAHLSSGALSASNVILTSEVTGTLPVTNGGTGTATAFTQGSVIFAGASGVYSQNNSAFFWDDTNKRLGIGTSTPSFDLEISKVSGTSAIRVISLDASSEAAIAVRTATATERYAALEIFGSTFANPALSDKASLTVGSVITGFSFITQKAAAAVDFKINSTTISTVIISDTTQVLQVIPQTASIKGVVVKGASSQSATLQEWQNSSAVELGSISAAGLSRHIAGAGTSFAKVGGNIATNFSAVGNTTTAETDLKTVTIAANTLGSNGDSIEFRAFGNTAASAATKRIRAYFGGTLIVDTGALAITLADNWMVHGVITRTGAATQYCGAQVVIGDASGQTYINMTAPAITLSSDQTLKITGTATNTNDIISFFWNVKWFPTG